MEYLLVIAAIGVLLILIGFIGDGFFGRRKERKERERAANNDMNIVREAAYAVIEASLMSEPKLWALVKEPDGRSVWLTNKKIGLALFLWGGPSNLYILRDLRKDATTARPNDKLTPPSSVRNSLYERAHLIVTCRQEEQEKKNLEEMVERFRIKMEENRNHDQEPA